MKPVSALTKTLISLIAASSFIASTPARAESNYEATRSNYSSQTASAQQAVVKHRSGYTNDEITSAGHNFFGNTTKGLARAVESVFAKYGRPQGYIIGQEGSGAFFGGLRYGEGMLYIKNGPSKKVFWQGPSIGFDAGGNGSRTLVLIYNIDSINDIYDRFVGIDGSAYLVGGFGVNFQSNEKLRLAPIRTGVGVRLGANVGYLKYTATPTWNPF